jgi:rare lipoprotein A (peptidoglycan hydrolase)
MKHTNTPKKKSPCHGAIRGLIRIYRLLSFGIICGLIGLNIALHILFGIQANCANTEQPAIKNAKIEAEILTANAQKPTETEQIVQRGTASWYDYDLKGEPWSKTHRTCASRFLKRYSTVIVKNLANGKEVKCYVNDYIEHPDRIIDLSSYAFSQIADLSTGLAKVEIRYK